MSIAHRDLINAVLQKYAKESATQFGLNYTKWGAIYSVYFKKTCLAIEEGIAKLHTRYPTFTDIKEIVQKAQATCTAEYTSTEVANVLLAAFQPNVVIY